MKKMIWKFGIGLVIGIGALLMAAPQAQADTPCPKDNCAYNGAEECSNSHLENDPAGSFRKADPGDYSPDEYGGCLDCTGSCIPYKTWFNVQYYYCNTYDGETGQLIPGHAYTTYNKEVSYQSEDNCLPPGVHIVALPNGTSKMG